MYPTLSQIPFFPSTPGSSRPATERLNSIFELLSHPNRPSFPKRILLVVQFPENGKRLTDTLFALLALRVEEGHVEIESGFEIWGERLFLRDFGGTGVQDL